MEIEDFRKEIQKLGEGFSVGEAISALMKKPEERVKYWQNEQMERNGVKSIKITVLKRFNYLAVSEQPIEPQIGKIHEI